MNRFLARIVAALAAAALFGGLVHLVLVVTHLSEPAATTVQGVTPPRLWATLAIALAALGAAIGCLVLARPDRFGAASGRWGAFAAILTGSIAAIGGARVLAVATGGPGTGNGVVGGAVAVVMGLFAAVLGALALTRARRIASAPGRTT